MGSLGPIGIRTVLVQARAWRWTGDKPLHEAKVALISDAYMRN